MMEEEERARIETEATRAANIENRLKNLEGSMARIWMAVLAAGAMVTTSIWDALKEALFK